MMEVEPSIPGPRTKAALALLERHRRRGARQSGRPPSPKPAKPEPAPSTLARRGAPVVSTISDVSRQLGLTMRAIRLYEEMGLIACGRGVKNARTLDEAAKARLRRIVDFKRLGLTISEIADIVAQDAAGSPALRLRLEAELSALDGRRAAIAAYLARLPAS